MADDDKIRYRDLVEPDDSIEKLIQQLQEMSKSYETMVNAIRAGATKIVNALKSASGATAEGKKTIDESTVAATRLERAYNELQFALSDTGKMVAQLRAQTSDANKVSVEQMRYAQQASTSYNRLKTDLRQMTQLYKSLTEAERMDNGMGGQLVDDILNLRAQISAIDAQLKPHIESMTQLEKAKQRLAQVQSAENVQLKEYEVLIRQANQTASQQATLGTTTAGSYDYWRAKLSQSQTQYNAMDDIGRESAAGQQLAQTIANLQGRIKAYEQAQREAAQAATLNEQVINSETGSYNQLNLQLQLNLLRLNAMSQAERENTQEGQRLVQETQELRVAIQQENQARREKEQIARLEAQMANSEVGSYNQLNAQYQLNVIRLNAMSQAMRETTAEGKALEEETRAIRARMTQLQEATGNYHASLGAYRQVWSGLGFSVTQVIRELPAAAVSLNTFFLGISNNIPIVIDEIKRLREQNKLLAAEGKQTVSVGRTIVRSIFSWQTALIALITVMSMHGQEIIRWIDRVLSGRNAALSQAEALERLSDEIEKNASSYGTNMAITRRLSDEWKALGDNAKAQAQWIKDNASEFSKLDVSITDVNTAEQVFNSNTSTFIEALKARAAAQAALNLLAEQYGELLKLENDQAVEQEKASNGGYTFFERTANYFKALWRTSPWGEDSDLSLSAGIATQPQANLEALDEDIAEQKSNIEQYVESYEKLIEEWRQLMSELGLDEAHRNTGRGQGPKDLTNLINANDIKVQRQYYKSLAELSEDDFAKRRIQAEAQVREENAKLRQMLELNDQYVKNVDGKYKQLTDDQIKQIEQQNDLIQKTIANNLQAFAIEMQRLRNEQAINTEQISRNNLTVDTPQPAVTAAQNQESVVTTNVVVTRDASQMEASLVEERRLMEENLNLKYELVLATNQRLLAEGNDQARSEEEIITEYNKKKLELYAEYDEQILKARETDIENQLDLVKKGSEEELQLLLAQNEVRRQLALAQNAAAPAAEQVSTVTINAQYDKSALTTQGDFELSGLEEQQALAQAEFDIEEHTQDEITRFRLEQERERWVAQIALAEAGALDWSDTQIATAKATVQSIDAELDRLDNIWNSIGTHGLGYTLLDRLGFNDKQIQALEDAVDTVMDNLSELFDAEVELAEAQVEAAEERVDAAQDALDAEIEARNNGYANNVATARKELEQEKKNQQEKEKMLAEAERRQEAIDSMTQVSSLITASANLWAVFSKMGIFGPALAAAAIAAMFASFAAAKIKARQVAAQTEEYGEGGLEFLEGGSHASGNDIDLGVDNSRGKRMRAEGGEAVAVINKRRTRQYRRILPDVVNSLNKGTFEEKYMNTFSAGQEAAQTLLMLPENPGADVDLSRIEEKLEAIRKNSETKYYVLPNGNMVMQRKNVKRVIKN